MDIQTVGQKASTISLAEYAANLKRSGVQVFPGGPGTFWTRYKFGAVMRQPAFYVGPPASNEVRAVLWRGWAALASYLLEPDARHPANAWLYVCTDQTYSLEKLSPEDMGRNVRRGLKKLRITPLTPDQVLAHGTQAFCETRRRLGLSDGTPEEFRQQFIPLTQLPEYVFLGAWKDDQLAAFQSIIEVDDWAILVGSYSTDALRRYKPNETLQYSALSHYLIERSFRLVCNGSLNTIHEESINPGLHRFKMKVGFEVHPVHRAFMLHPLLHPFTNRVTLWGVNTALRFRPENRRLKKAGAVLASILGDTRGLEQQ